MAEVEELRAKLAKVSKKNERERWRRPLHFPLAH
jgi:hypothetical protein